jgi:Phage derived protein Gp49-like (DUF891)
MLCSPGMAWRVEVLDETVAQEVGKLPADMRARFLRIAERIEAPGLPNVGEPHVKHLRGEICEMRMTGRDGIARALNVTRKGGVSSWRTSS